MTDEKRHIGNVEGFVSSINTYKQIIQDYLVMMSNLDNSDDLMLEYDRIHGHLELLLEDISSRNNAIIEEIYKCKREVSM